ncbi:MAG TPA: hypothetical protein VLA02_04440, partial [Reyranella sp.]|nr:hypothetical protein [Reyranella sp.]
KAALAATFLAGSAVFAYAQTSSTLGAGGSTAGSGSTSSTMGVGGSSAGTSGLDKADDKAGKRGAQGREIARDAQDKDKTKTR